MNNASRTLAWALSIALIQSATYAHDGGKNVTLHINPRWSECSFQLDRALTQQAWRDFTQEAGLVVYFRPLSEARPMGVGNYEFSIIQWNTAIDDEQPKWNDTFVHPDSVHWLKEGPRLMIPGLTFRAGISEKVDVGAFWTISPGANYGFWGGQVQYNIMRGEESDWAASARGSFVSLYGPEDFDLTVYGLDLFASKQVATYSDWVRVSAYGGVSAFFSRSHEKSAVVQLTDENVLGALGTVGVVTNLSAVRVAFEYNVAKVSTYSIKIGVGI